MAVKENSSSKNMKTVYCILVICLVLVACDKDNPQPADRFIGSWFGELSGQGVHIDVSFKVINSDKDDYNYGPTTVNWAEVPYTIVPSGLTYSVSAENKFAANDGFGQIDIWGNSEDMWVLIRLKSVKMFENGGGWTTPGGLPIDKSIPYVMTVDEVQIEKMNSASIVLGDQMFVRTR